MIRCSNVSKRFALAHAGGRTLKSAFIDMVRGTRRDRGADEYWALRDVSFTVDNGETVGIIGPNGAGKSTLLALISGTMDPTSGSIQREGDIASLLELGAGFHPDLTGRENVFLYGAVMGLSRRVMERRFGAIVDFAGLDKWIDEPVKHYSSGMYVRLGFAVAVEVDPDVLVIDEVLAVGDASFQRKCLQRIAEFRERGKTLLVVSHDLGVMKSVCDRLVLLDEGRLLAYGQPGEVLNEYQRIWRRGSATEQREWGTRDAIIERVEFMDQHGSAGEKFRSGEPMTVRIHISASKRIPGPVFGFSISTAAGVHVCGNNTQIEGIAVPDIEGNSFVDLVFDSLPLGQGMYFFSFSMHSQDHKINYHRLDNAFPISVDAHKGFEGCCYVSARWSLKPGAISDFKEGTA